MHDSSFGRLIGVLASPAATFRSIAARPTAAVAILVLVVLGIVVVAGMMARTDTEEMVRAQLERGGQELSEEDMENAVVFAEKFKYAGPIGGIAVGFPLFCLAVAGLFLVAFRVQGSELTFRQSLSTFVHGMMPTGVASLLAIPVVLTRGEFSLEEVEAGSPLLSNLGFLAPEEASRATVALLTSVDVFSLWSVVLLAMGYSIVGRVSTGKAAGTVAVLWILGVAIKVGLATLGG